MITVDFRDRRPIYEQLTVNITRLVISGVMEPGEQLPPVRKLSSDLGINPNTIQRAYTELERRNIAYTIQGKGCFIVEDIKDILNTKRIELFLQYEILTEEAAAVKIALKDILSKVEEYYKNTHIRGVNND